MPSSFVHDFFIKALRDEPNLVSGLLAGLDVSVEGRVTVVDAAFSAPVVGYQADVAFLVGDVLVVVEVQLRKDPRKHTSWPIYEATSRARHPACVLVVTTDAEVARWAAEPIPLGPSGSVCRPLVIGPDLLTDPSLAKHPGIAAMASIAHPSDATLAVKALVACAGLPEDKREVYSEVILMALDDVARKAVEMNLLDLTKYSPDDPFVKKYKRVQAELREVFGTQLLGEAIIRFLGARRIRVSAAQRKRILACHDRATLDRWITRAARAERAADVFAARPARARRSGRRPQRQKRATSS